jgi:hypothetical protein
MHLPRAAIGSLGVGGQAGSVERWLRLTLSPRIMAGVRWRSSPLSSEPACRMKAHGSRLEPSGSSTEMEEKMRPLHVRAVGCDGDNHPQSAGGRADKTINSSNWRIAAKEHGLADGRRWPVPGTYSKGRDDFLPGGEW